MSESTDPALFYLVRQAKTDITKMNLTTNEEIIDHHFRCAHDALDVAIRLLSKD